MLTIELARIRVEEAIQEGLRAQHIQRSLGRRKESVSTATLLMFGLALLLAMSLGACVATASTPASTQPLPTATEQAAPPSFVSSQPLR